MVDVTLFLVGAILLLLGANYWISLTPRKAEKERVNVTFIPPAAGTVISQDPEFHAHAQAVNQKIALLFSRVEALEKDISAMKGNENPPELDWIQTVPTRKTRKKKSVN